MSSWKETVGVNLKELLESQNGTDFVLTCTDGEVKCHKLMLLGAGGVLRSKVEQRLIDDVNRLDICTLGISKSQAKSILAVVYGGIADELTEENVPHFVHFAYHYGLKWLMAEIISKFESVLTEHNVLQIYSNKQISTSKHLSRFCETFCETNCKPILEVGFFTNISEDALMTILNSATKYNDIDHFKLFSKVKQWIISDDRNIRSCINILTQIPFHKIPKSKIQSDIYDFLFNQLIIGNSDNLSKEDKVLLSSLYQQALNSNNITDINDTGIPISISLESTKPLNSQLDLNYLNLNGKAEVVKAATTVDVAGSDSKRSRGSDRAFSIIPYITSRSWQNMEFPEVKEVVQKEELMECEYLVVESIMLWIASDIHHRKQHCENLLRCCRFCSICPVYVQSVLATFVTEKMVGSVRLSHSIFRQPSTPRTGSTTSRLGGVCEDIPLSVQRLKLGNHSLSIKCSCGRSNCVGILQVSRDIPTAVLNSFNCHSCGIQEVKHTTCSSTLTPDIFPSMYLLPFNHLSKVVASMDDMRIFFFL